MATIRKYRGKFKVEIRRLGFPKIYKTFIEKKNANKWAKKMEAEMENGIFEDTSVAATTTVRELLWRYKEEMTPKKKGSREETHKLNFLIRHKISSHTLMKLRSSHIYKLMNELEENERKPQTIKHYVHLLSVVWNTAKKIWGITLPAQSPFELVALGRVRNERNIILNAEEYKRLLTETDKSHLNCLSDLVRFLYLTGARYGEASELLRDNTDLKGGVATFVDTKNGEDREIPLDVETISILKKYPFGDKFFNCSYHVVYEEFNKAKVAARLNDFRMHDLRACFITNNLQRGHNIAEVAAMSGHKSYTMLKRYTRIKAKDLVETVNKKLVKIK